MRADFDDRMLTSIRSGIQAVITEQSKVYIEEAKRKLDAYLPELIARLSLVVTEHKSMYDMTQHVTFHLEVKEKKNES